ncbi:TPA: divalent-cation tolerance protein CutA [Candidatus Nomurabacteria bacterium]|nr:divalent-cation tolerance protein CutA [Candidatus Nomurabacteria bacterium]
MSSLGRSIKDYFSTPLLARQNKEEADKVVNHLLEKRLIACANFSTIESRYWWKGGIENGEEIVTLLKTKKENFELVRDEILKIHPYEIPCILKLDAEVNESYGKWILNETTPNP